MWLSLPPALFFTTQKSIPGIVYNNPKRSKPGLVEIPIKSSEGRFTCRGKDLPWLNVSKLNEGDSAILLVTLLPLNKSLNPFSFDSQKWIRGESGHCIIIASSKSINSNKDYIAEQRSYFLESLYSAIKNRTTAGVMAAMSVGDTSKLNPLIDRAFRDTGLYHLLVVSGYQVMFLFFMIKQVIFYFLPRSKKESGIASISGSIIGLSVGFYFALLTGLESATERAIVGVIIGQVILLLGLKVKTSSVFLFTALLLSIVYPGIFLTPSFHLTFAALFGLLIAEAASKNLIFQGLISTASATASAGLMSFLWFGNITLLSLFMNIIFAPLFSLVTTAGTLVGVISLKIFSSNFILKYSEWTTELLLFAVSRISKVAPEISVQYNYIYGFLSVMLILILTWRYFKTNNIHAFAIKSMRRKIGK